MKKYKNMNLDALFAELCKVSIEVHEAYCTIKDVEVSNKFMDIKYIIHEEIRSRGEASRPYYLKLLTSEIPILRLTAGLNVINYNPALAVPVLEELRVGKYGGGIAGDARMTLDAMRKRGEIP